ncbi:MAG: hypothetical protein H0S85_16565 [Desulfovibrionaceae bacterium]|jgi:hypothetical protein|nr:hypothetical protein [Desulfovibrionaceae bacterium]
MSINLNLPVLLVQTPIAGSIAHAEQSSPEIQQTVAAHEAVLEQKKRREQIQGTEKQDPALAVHKDGGGGGGRGEERARERGGEERPPPAETAPHSESPWTGNVINRKI